MPVFKEFYQNSADCENKIYCCVWLPDSGAPKAAVQISHGISESIARYDALARHLAENGFAVVGNDHLGHGKSCAKTEDLCFFGEELGWFLVLEDMHRLYEKMHGEFGDIPYFLLGHSLGSFLARTFLINYPGDLSGCIISGTGQQSPALCGLGLIAAAFETLRSGKRGRSKTLNRLCFGNYNIHIKEQDGENRSDIPTNALVRDMLIGIRYVQRRGNLALMDKSTPVLFFSGAQDAVGGYGKGVENAANSFRRAGCTDVTLKLYPNGRHRMFDDESCKDELYSDIVSWLESKI